MPAAGPGLKQVAGESLPARALRGYGALSGAYAAYECNAGRCSYLLVHCQDAEKAKLLHAKFASDLRLMGRVYEVRVAVGGIEIPALAAQDQGLIVAGRVGAEVHIVIGATRESLTTLLATSPLTTRQDAEFAPAVSVPMYLDSWDKYAFRFYYRPWEAPTATGWGSGKLFPDTKWKDYNVLKEFDYAKEHGDLGFIFWAGRSDGADGLNHDNYWNWATRAAQRRNLPTIINDMVGWQNSTAPVLNRYRDQTMMGMPQYCGTLQHVADHTVAGEGGLSWCATSGLDAALAQTQQLVGQYAAQSNVLEFMEPHCEMDHGDQDLFLEYGPVADRSFQHFLQEKHKTLDVVSGRWFGQAGRIASWDNVRVPELASFLGWGPDALDLTGKWRVGLVLAKDASKYSEADRKALADHEAVVGSAPPEWFKPDFDDARWPTVQAPGNDWPMIVPRRAAVYRQTIQVDAAWRSRHLQAWLYVWDLEDGWNQWVDVWLNGGKVGHDLIVRPHNHWMALDVTKALKDGANQLALSLPNGFLAYRIYLSPQPPLLYPNMSAGDNAKWVDFIDWRTWTRVEGVRRGMAMIRRADPNRSIICASPDAYQAGIKRLCEEYGGHFHNTGYMGVFFAEYLPMLMRGADLPFSLETDSPAPNLADFKNKMGLYLSEGVNALHYYIHIGSILWQDDIRQEFEKDLPIIRMLGQTHVPKAQTALLLSDRVNSLTYYPWGGRDYNSIVGNGWRNLNWKLPDYVGDEFPMDAVTDQDFPGGDADPYHVIIDNNNAIMDATLVDQVESWVRKGGVFVAFVQTGRHLPEQADAWPISRLTGYRVTGIDPYEADGTVKQWRKLKFAPGQNVFAEAQWDAKELSANGLSLQKQDAQCRDLVLWEDGSVAVGLRPLGKGCVIHVGAKFANNKIWSGNPVATRRFFSQLLEWAKVARLPARAEFTQLAPLGATADDAQAHHGLGDGIMLRHRVSNNGLYDAWALWNRDAKHSLTTDVVFAAGLHPAWCRDVRTGQAVALATDGAVCRAAGLKMEPLEIRLLLTPRTAVEQAALDWFKLQRNWWRGTTAPRPAAPEDVKPWPVQDLTGDWAVLPLDDKNAADQTPLAAPSYDDATWQRMPLQAWAVGEELPTHHALFRKVFNVSQAWAGGELRLWIQSWLPQTLHGRLRVWLDGKEVPEKPLKPNMGLPGLVVTDICRPGGHCLAVEVVGEGTIAGVYGNAWLSCIPEPQARLDLAGAWTPSRDALHDGQPVTLPGPLEAMTARRTAVVDAAHADQTVYLHATSSAGWVGVMINGHFVRRSRSQASELTHLNITPWIRFGQVNEIELVQQGSGNQIRQVGLWFYNTQDRP